MPELAAPAGLTLVPWESLTPEACVDFYRRNRTHLAPWWPSTSNEFYSVEHQGRLQARFAQGRSTDREYAYAVMVDGSLAGRVALSDVIRGVFQSAHLGYLTDAQQCGRGVATGAVGEITRLAFERLELHRVQAAVIPRNLASMRVVAKCAFSEIGLAPRYLLINGRWEDHVLFAKTVEDFSSRQRPVAPLSRRSTQPRNVVESS